MMAGQICAQKLEEIFSKGRLDGYKNASEHRENFLLIGKIGAKIGVLEVAIRNRIAKALGITDDKFISSKTLGYWERNIETHKIHNQILNLRAMDFRKYSKFNKKDKLLNYQKVSFAYTLFRLIRNRAFHFENLYKINADGTPRINKIMGSIIVNIAPEHIEDFIDDLIFCFDEDLVGYLENGG
ncbi:ATPase [uncultured Campylobacter sp.]|uniref:ATPase n=1 Tax=uncultured Campylobacter sp. TaxID=218934 RepID=UPI0028E72EEF|nr:ATPase [uncultured Campylobacter sp.]